MICGIRGCEGDPVVYWEANGERHYRCQLHEYELVPQDAVRHDYQLGQDGSDTHQEAPAYRIVPDPEARAVP
jgi:hypothetical protein